MLAYDQSRVLLTHDDKEVYVNANRVKVAAADREYILTQGEIDKIHFNRLIQGEINIIHSNTG